MYKYCRFYLSESLNEEALKKFQLILKNTPPPGFIRASFDLIGSNKSISILCESEENSAIAKDKWRRLLLENKIDISEKIEHELLDEEHLHTHCDHTQACHHDHHDHHHHHHENHWLKATLGLIWGISLLALSLTPFNIPMIAYYIITSLSTFLTLYLGHKVYQSAWHALLQKKWDMNTLYTISTLSIVGISVASLFIPGLPMMLESGPFILGFLHLGEAIEHTLLNKINEKLDVRDCAPSSTLLKNESNKIISVKQLIPNDIIIVKKGEVIPVDGVLNEPALLYTTRIDGSPHLKHFSSGEPVKAGMCLAAHFPTLEIRVTKTHQNSYLSLIAKNINKANDEKAPIELFANKILKYFIPGLLTVSMVSGVVIGLFFSPTLAIQCAIAVLVSACPCALSLITPMAVRIGMKKSSEKGAHYKNGKALQAAADIDTVVFDLNGTLTQGEISVENLNIKEKQLLKFIATLESLSEHPVSKTIQSYLEQQGIAVDKTLVFSSVDKNHHSGIKGVINGETFMIGNKEMLFANGVQHIHPPYNDIKNGTIYIAQGFDVIGQIKLNDPLRKDAIETIKQLKSMGKQVHICTGSDKETAEHYAALLGVSSKHICSNAIGAAATADETSKESYINHLKRQGRKVAMIGDAANDLTAIASADLGIAVKSNIGDTITEQHAGMIVQQGLLFPIATALDIAAKTKQNIFQNLFVSLSYNSVITLTASGLFLILGFTLNPAVGVALMALESTLVLANLYRLKHQKVLSYTSYEPVHKETTSNVLHALGHLQPQPNQSLQDVCSKTRCSTFRMEQIVRVPNEMVSVPLPGF